MKMSLMDCSACRLLIAGFLLGLPWKIVAIRSSETSVDLHRTKRRYNAEGRTHRGYS
jgi:hypothetical protein